MANAFRLFLVVEGLYQWHKIFGLVNCLFVKVIDMKITNKGKVVFLFEYT